MKGPLAVAVTCNDEFMNYGSGILVSPAAATEQINHAVTMVGWGIETTTGQEYWIIRNSWSESWGEKGFIRLATEGNTRNVMVGIWGMSV